VFIIFVIEDYILEHTAPFGCSGFWIKLTPLGFSDLLFWSMLPPLDYFDIDYRFWFS